MITLKEIIYNYDYLTEEDITEIVIRMKVLIINSDNIYIVNENGIFQFSGGHLEKNETLLEGLKREVLEKRRKQTTYTILSRKKYFY